jgi:hypothetical protein
MKILLLKYAFFFFLFQEAVLNDIKQDKEFFIGQFISGLYGI